MPTPKPIPAHGALGELPPDDAATAEQAMSPPEYETDDDATGTEYELPESLPPSGTHDNS